MVYCHVYNHDDTLFSACVWVFILHCDNCSMRVVATQGLQGRGIMLLLLPVLLLLQQCPDLQQRMAAKATAKTEQACAWSLSRFLT